MNQSNGISDAPQTDVSDVGVEGQQTESSASETNSVKYDTYKRTVGEAKKYKSQVDELRQKLTQFEQGQLQAEGKKDELIDNLRKQNSELNSKLSKAVGNFAKSKVYETMLKEASKLGCQDPDLVLKAYADELETIDFDDSFNPDTEQIRATLTKVREERPYLFSKEAPKIANHQIKTQSVSGETGKKSLKELKTDDLMALWSKAHR